MLFFPPLAGSAASSASDPQSGGIVPAVSSDDETAVDIQGCGWRQDSTTKSYRQSSGRV